MKALSLLPPGRKGVPRGCGRLAIDVVPADVTEDGGGERMKPPDCGGEDMLNAGSLATTFDGSAHCGSFRYPAPS